MINILFFGRFREELGQAQLNISCAGLSTVDSLREALIALHTPKWREVLTAPNVIIAVNHTVVDGAFGVYDDDEVAFYPPVTGG